MKWVIKNGTLVARGLLSVKFRASPAEISVVKVMTEHDYYGPLNFIRKLFLENKVQLRFVMFRSDHGDCTLDVKRDSGSSAVISWLASVGWNIDEAIHNAMKTPLIRVAVSKTH